MKTKVYNVSNLKMKDINEFVYRSRGIIINSKKEILFGYSLGTYQFPGGFVEKGETNEEGLIREIKEETGIEIKTKKLKPFYKIIYINKDYPISKSNRYTEFNYYIIETDKSYNLKKTKYDDSFEERHFKLSYIPFCDVNKKLSDTLNNNPKNIQVYSDIVDVLSELKKIYNGENDE